MCTRYEAGERPTFANILCFLEKIELSKRQQNSQPHSARMEDEAHHELPLVAASGSAGSRLRGEPNSAGCFSQLIGPRRKLAFADYYQTMMQS